MSGRGGFRDFGVVLDELPLPTYVADAGTVIYVNAAFCELLGLGAEELVGRSIVEFVAPEDLPNVMDRHARRLRGEPIGPHNEFSMLAPPSTERIAVRSTAKLMTIEGVSYSIGTAIDIRERLAMEAELERKVAHIREQAAELQRLTAPLIRVAEGVIVVPLLGSFDATRSERLIGEVVDSLPKLGVRELVLDLTGLRFGGPGVLAALTRIARVSAMLGARCTLAGLSPELARSFVDEGVGTEDFEIAANLAQALAQRGRSRP